MKGPSLLIGLMSNGQLAFRSTCLSMQLLQKVCPQRMIVGWLMIYIQMGQLNSSGNYFSTLKVSSSLYMGEILSQVNSVSSDLAFLKT